MMVEGRTAIVTGASGNGMGRSIALTLAREGANIVVNYLNSADSAAAIVAHIVRSKVLTPSPARPMLRSRIAAKRLSMPQLRRSVRSTSVS